MYTAASTWDKGTVVSKVGNTAEDTKWSIHHMCVYILAYIKDI